MAMNKELIEELNELYEGDHNIPCIDMLRQWLNERPKDKLVTTKELEHWLEPMISRLRAADELVEGLETVGLELVSPTDDRYVKGFNSCHVRWLDQRDSLLNDYKAKIG